jgi:gamma-glutamylcyclotransferase (GGCT)/AIG2-like uncharacterized protein YtfP
MSENISVVGYGTFITKGYWKNKSNVMVCRVIGFKRIFPKGNWFPYVLPDPDSSFWALKFDVNQEELRKLDYYEGVPSGLYKRVKTVIELKDGSKIQALIYVPTESTIKREDLALDMDKSDRWKQEIAKHLEIIEEFPELVK